MNWVRCSSNLAISAMHYIGVAAGRSVGLQMFNEPSAARTRLSDDGSYSYTAETDIYVHHSVMPSEMAPDACDMYMIKISDIKNNGRIYQIFFLICSPFPEWYIGTFLDFGFYVLVYEVYKEKVL
ncbi:hypothetical protein AVEN_129608-1 [Araneus ventricosus]|uniref:Uncharacterized protein n=1 Tax=Araneus ventricosus TaxID=182803 RepID=A0A4Y2LSY5_ARAVE|nr:hypothetical protein AVEN_129608-1 [Araneus ventricosus]